MEEQAATHPIQRQPGLLPIVRDFGLVLVGLVGLMPMWLLASGTLAAPVPGLALLLLGGLLWVIWLLAGRSFSPYERIGPRVYMFRIGLMFVWHTVLIFPFLAVMLPLYDKIDGIGVPYTEVDTAAGQATASLFVLGLVWLLPFAMSVVVALAIKPKGNADVDEVRDK